MKETRYYVSKCTVEFHSTEKIIETVDIFARCDGDFDRVSPLFASLSDAEAAFEQMKGSCCTYTFSNSGMTFLHADILQLESATFNSEDADEEDLANDNCLLALCYEYGCFNSFVRPFVDTLGGDFDHEFDESMMDDEFSRDINGSILVRRDSFESLVDIAVQKNAPQEYIDALGEWFCLFGDGLKVDGQYLISSRFGLYLVFSEEGCRITSGIAQQEAPMTDFSNKLRAARAAAGLSQQRMAAITLIPSRTIESWESGIRTPPPYVQRFVLNELKSLVSRSD